MASRTLTVKIVGDERDLARAFKSGGRHAQGFGKRLGDVSVKSALAAGGLTILAQKATRFGMDSLRASAEAGASAARVERSVKNAGLAYGDYEKQIDSTIQAQSELSGFDDEDLADSFANMVRRTGDVSKALRDNALAADVARGRQADLSVGVGIVTKAAMGQVGALRKLGIDIRPVTTAQDALRGSTEKVTVAQRAAAKETDRQATAQLALATLQRQFGGQARDFGETTAGSIAKATVAWENLQETVGNKIAPTFQRGIQIALEHGDAIETGGRVALTAVTAYGAYRVALAGVAVQSKIAAVATVGFTNAIKVSPIGIVAGAVGALAGAYLLLRGRVGDSQGPQERMNETFRHTADASRAAAAGIDAQKAATDRLKGSQIDVTEARLAVQEAAERERATRGTKEHERAVLDLRRAKLTLSDSTRRQTADAVAARTETGKALVTTRREVLAAQDALATARLQAQLFPTSVEGTKNIRKAQDDLNIALKSGANRHREIAREAREQAGATGTATKEARDLKLSLEKIATVNVNLAAATDAFRVLGGAASGARDQVNALIGRLNAASGAKVPSVGGGGGQSKKEVIRITGGKSKFRPGLTIAESAGAALGAGARDDSLQDKRARSAGEAAGTAAGVTNPEKLREMGETAVLRRRQAEVKARKTIVAGALKKVRSALTTTLRARDKAYGEKRGIPKGKNAKEQEANNKKRASVQHRIDKLNDTLSRLWGDERGLMDQEADLKAEANELGFDIQVSAADAAALPDAAETGSAGSEGGGSDAGGGATGNTEEEKLRAGVSLAGLTEGTHDDVSALQSLLGFQDNQLAAAISSGNYGEQSRIASEIKSLREEIARLTGATQDNTVATEEQTTSFSGSVVFGHRGQSYTVPQSSDRILDLGLT